MEPIAIIGIGCRLPGEAGTSDDIKTPSALWDLLAQKKDSYTDFPANRLNVDAFYHPDQGRPGSFYTRGGCFLKEDPRQFDPSFFGMNPQETATLDPSSRKLLETTYEAFESSGTSLDSISGSSTGVFVGNFNADQQMMQSRDTEYHRPYAMVGGDNSLLGNRISYLFNLHGPSLSVNTACSSSMYALHLACTAIRAGDCDGAVVGGSNLLLSPDYQLYSAGLGGVSKTSICHTFDASADGYARAEGICVLHIKTLSKAIKDNDPIRAVIRGTTANANGRTGGITHPDPGAQERLIREAYTRAGNLDPKDTGYLECHGTGTAAGDPLEVEAAGRVFAERKSPAAPLLIGSIKTNIGHSEATSGLSGIIKTVLAVEKGQIPPIRALDELNPNVNLRDGRLRVVTDMTPWPESKFRRASVSSFGYGGANAHVILEQAGSMKPSKRHLTASWAMSRTNTRGSSNSSSDDELEGHTTPATPMSFDGDNAGTIHYSKDSSVDRQFLLPFSAHNEQTLRQNINAYCTQTSKWNAADLAYTLGCRRSRLAYRSFFVASRLELESGQMTPSNPPVAKSRLQRTSRLGFIFTGQGAQYPQMGKDLMERFPVYLQSIRRMDKVLSKLSSPPEWNMEEILSAPADSSRVYESGLSLVVVTAVQVALVDLLASWDVMPTASVGHSSGEIGAAYASGSLTSSEAILIAYARGRAVSRSTTKGAMLAVAMSAETAQPYLNSRQGIVVACQNSPESTTISGDHDSIMDLKVALESENLFARVVATGGRAYHSPHMSLVGESYETELNEMLRSLDSEEKAALKPKSEFYSSVREGTQMQRPAKGSYWRQNLESPVLFRAAVATMVNNTTLDALIEVGPHAALRGPVRQILQSLDSAKRPEYLPTLVRKEDGAQCLLQTAGTLWSKGHELNFAAVNTTDRMSPDGQTIISGRPNQVVTDLPPYKWQYGELNYPENRFNREWRLRTHPRHDILGSRQPGGNANEPMWRNILKVDSLPWLKDHKLGNDIVFPAAAYILMATEAAMQMVEVNGASRADFKAYRCEGLRLTAALVIPEGSEGVEVLFNLRRSRKPDGAYQDSRYEFTITSVTDSSSGHIFEENAHGSLATLNELPAPVNDVSTGTCNKPVSTARWYDAFEQRGLVYGDTFQAINNLAVSKRNFSARSEFEAVPTGSSDMHESEYSIHPSRLDATIQLAIIAAHRGRFSELSSGFIPVSFENVTVWPGNADLASKTVTATSNEPKNASISARVSMMNLQGQHLVELDGVRLVKQDIVSPAAEDPHPFTKFDWKPDPSLLSDEGTKQLWASSSQGARQSTASLNLLDELVLNQCIQFSQQHGDAFKTKPLAPHLQRLHSWMMQQVELARDNKLAGSKAALSRSVDERSRYMAETQAKLTATNAPETRLMCQMYEHLPAIFGGDVTGIQVAMQDDLLNNWYKHMDLFREGGIALKQLVELLSFKNPSMSIFEIGGGTGSATREVLRALKGDNLFAGYSSYMFTDIGPAFLSAAQTEFEGYHGMQYRPFDMERPVDQQNFTSDHDLVIASNVIHVTTDIVKTLQNVRRILKPGGKLAMLEIIRPAPFWTMILGTFSDFWKGDLDPSCPRTEGPFITRDNWERILPLCGFSGLDLALDHFTEDGGTAVLLATAVEPKPAIMPNPSVDNVTVVYRESLCDASTRLVDYLHAEGYTVETTPLHQTDYLAGKRVICLAEIDGPLFSNCSEAEFHGAKDILLNTASALWITGGQLAGSDSAPISGLLAANSSTRVVSLDLGPGGLASKTVLGHIRELENRAASLLPSDDREFQVRDGIIYTSRLVEEELLNKAEAPVITLDGESSYLLVDCLDDIGLSISGWMVASGAKHLTYLSTPTAANNEREQLLRDFNELGIDIQILDADLTSSKSLQSTLESALPRPLKGIIRGTPRFASPSPLSSLSFAEFTASFQTYASSTHNLHTATLSLPNPLDFFLLTTSLTSILPSSNPALTSTSLSATTTFAHAFASFRQSTGHTASTLCLGPILDIGPESHSLTLQESLAQDGLPGLSEQSLRRSLAAALTHSSISPILTSVTPHQLHSHSSLYPTTSIPYLSHPRYSYLANALTNLQHTPSSSALDHSSSPDDDPSDPLATRIRKRIARTLYISPEDIDPERPIAQYGIDSLVAAEIRAWLKAALGVEVGLLRLLGGGGSVKGLAEMCEGK